MAKRGKLANPLHFRKGWARSPLAIAIAGLALTGCDDGREEVKVVKDPQDCAANTEMTLAQCELAYQQAQEEAEQTAPRYSRLEDCIAEFGADMCHRSSDGSFFMPFMAGWMVSSALNNIGNRNYYNPVFRYNDRDRGTGYYTAGGSRLIFDNGSMRAPKGAATTKQATPKVMKTASRGGWGSTASAKSSWGGGKKSGSWGG